MEVASLFVSVSLSGKANPKIPKSLIGRFGNMSLFVSEKFGVSNCMWALSGVPIIAPLMLACGVKVARSLVRCYSSGCAPPLGELVCRPTPKPLPNPVLSFFRYPAFNQTLYGASHCFNGFSFTYLFASCPRIPHQKHSSSSRSYLNPILSLSPI